MKDTESESPPNEHAQICGIPYEEVLPEEWLATYGPWAWISLFLATGVDSDLVNQQRFAAEDAVALIFSGAPQYYPRTRPRILSMSPPQFALEVRPEVGPAGTYLLTAIPYQTDSGGDYVAREDAQALTGLLRSTLGENIAFEPLSEFGFSPETNLQKGFSESVRRPARDQNPDLSRIEFSQRAYTALWKLGRHERNRVKLSLRWHERARRARGVDSFINQWIALEALGMEKQDNLRPLEETLARVYGTSRDDARQRFGLNLIFGLRGETLHKGVVPVYRSDLEDYLRALYQDLLSARLGLPSDKRAEAILERDGFDLNDLLRSARQEPANPDWAKG